MQKYNREEVLEELGNRFENYTFEIKVEDFEEKLYIISSERKDFKTTITLGEYPVTEDQLESIVSILDGTIQLLKYHSVI